MKTITQSAQRFQASDKSLNDLADFYRALIVHEREFYGADVSDETLEAYHETMDIMGDWTGYNKTRFTKAIRAMSKVAQQVA